MDCLVCQYELSQCLDGRLASGRRTLVMQHVDDCASCAQFWAELQKAQELVLRLPSHHTGPDFREQLFARIRSGEGTPDAVFREPIPFGTKVRYSLTGAAAAAAVLLLASLWRTNLWHTDAPLTTGPVAKVNAGTGAVEPPTIASHASSGGLQPRVRNFDPAGAAFMNSVEPLTPRLIATEVAEDLRDNLSLASTCATRVVSTQQPAADASVVNGLRSRAAEVQRLGSVILELQQTRHVRLPEPVYYNLRYTVEQLDDAMQGRDANASRIARVVLQARELADLPRKMELGESTMLSPDDLDLEMARLFQSHQDTLQKLFLYLPNDGNLESFTLDPTRRIGVFQLRGDCGPNFVVSKRLKERRQAHFQNMIQSESSQPGSIRIEVDGQGEQKR